MKKFYRIQVVDSLNIVSEIVIPSGYISDKKLNILLQTLAAKHGLSDNEIVSCFTRKNLKNYKALLNIRIDVTGGTKECGLNPVVIASLVDEHGQRVVISAHN